MANWTLYFASGVGFGAELPSAFVDAVDVQLTKVPNASDGSAHSATSPVQIGGAGAYFPGSFRADHAQVTFAARVHWGTNTAFSAGDLVVNGSNLYLCVVGGTSANAGGGPTGTGTGIVDNTCTWNFVTTVSSFDLTIRGTGAVASGGTFTVQSGGTLSVDGTLSISGALNVFGTETIEAGGEFVVASGGIGASQVGGLVSLLGPLRADKAFLTIPSVSAWAPTTPYSVGDLVRNPSSVYVCVVSGASAGSGGPTGMGTFIIDGGVTWNFVDAPVSSSGLNIAGAAAVNSGGVLAIQVGGLLGVLGDLNVTGTATISAGGNFNVASGGQATVQSGGGLNIASGAGLDVSSGGTATVHSSATLAVLAGATFNVGADMLRTGADLPSGAGAYRALRSRDGSTGTVITNGSAIDATTAEIIVIPPIPGATHWTNTLATPPKSVRITLLVPTVGGGSDFAITTNSVIPVTGVPFMASLVYDTVTTKWYLDYQHNI